MPIMIMMGNSLLALRGINRKYIVTGGHAMIAWEWLRFLLGAALLLGGIVVFVIEIFGVFKFKYVLNRMHIAAAGDTLGIGLSMLGLALMNGMNFNSVKMLLVVIFLWIASPVASHMLARFEVTTNERLGEHCELPDDKNNNTKN